MVFFHGTMYVMEKPKFKKVGENTAGYPIYERDYPGLEKYEKEGLSSKQKRALRGVLLAVGVSVLPIKDSHNDSVNESGFDQVAATEVVDLEIDGLVDLVQSEDMSEQSEVSHTEMVADAEVTQLDSLLLDRYLNTAAQVKEMQRDQVLFVDSEGRALTDPVSIPDTAGYTTEEITWRYHGRTDDPENIKPVGIPGVWTKEQKSSLSEISNIPASEIEMKHVYLSLAGEGMENINSEVELIQARKAALEAELGVTVEELVAQSFSFESGDEFEHLIESELMTMMPALIAQESHYNADATSSAGAKGWMQFMDAAWKRHAENGASRDSLPDSLKAAGSYFSAAYRYMNKNVGAELSLIKDNYFAGNQADFVHYFLIPVLINDFNAGDTNMRAVIEWFGKNYAETDTLTGELGIEAQGFDVYFAMSQLANKHNAVPDYQDYASSYYGGVASWQVVMEDSYDQGSDEGEFKVASLN